MGARLGATLAYQMYLVGIAWHLYTLTGSAVDLGLVGLCQFVPNMALCLVVGPVVDGGDRRRLLRHCQALIATALAALAVASALGGISRGLLFGLVVLIACVRTFEGPTQQALLPQLATPEVLPRAVAWSGSTLKLASIVGPVCGGLLAAAGPGVLYATSACLYVLSLSLLARLRPREHRVPGRALSGRGRPLQAADLFAGFSYVTSKPVLLGAVTLDAMASLLAGATALFPIMARDVLHLQGAWGLGLLRSSMAAGALTMAICLGRRPIGRHVGRVMFASVALYGLATILFGCARSLWLSVTALLLVGAADMVGVVVRQSLAQLETPDRMRGRVGAVTFTFISASNQLGQVESGLSAAWLGPVGSIVLGGVGTLVVVAAWSRLFPALFRRDRMLSELRVHGHAEGARDPVDLAALAVGRTGAQD